MQIFEDNKFITGVEYREEDGSLRDGSFMIPDDSPEAKKILEGFAFTVEGEKVIVSDQYRKEVKDKKQAEEAEKVELEKQVKIEQTVKDYMVRLGELKDIIEKGKATDADRDEALVALMAIGVFLYNRGMFESTLPDLQDPLVKVKVKV